MTPPVASAGTRMQLEKIDQKIVALLDERLQLCTEVRERDEAVDGREIEEEILSGWAEDAIDRAMDEVSVEKIGQMVIKLCKQEE